MKSRIVFINQDSKAVVRLIKEIGKERYECALTDNGLTGQFRPKRTTDFFFEYDNNDTFLCHQYPMMAKRRLLNANGFWAVPKQGWEMKRIEIE